MDLRHDPNPTGWLQALETPPTPTVEDQSQKSIARMPFSGYGGGGWGLASGWGMGPWGPTWMAGMVPGSKKDYFKDAGALWQNSVVAICLGWLQDQFVQARPCLYEEQLGGDDQAVKALSSDQTEFLELLRNPNDGYESRVLYSATLLSYKCHGNAYWMKVRKGMGYGRPGQLWWVPHWMMFPRWPTDGSKFIDHYDYVVDGRRYPVDPEDVVHFRDGMDPYNTRLGLARLKAAIRNIVGLNKAETYVENIISNSGVPPVIWVPEKGVMELDDDQAKKFKRRYKEETSGENVGDPFVSSFNLTPHEIGRGPGEMGLDTILDRPESTVCAALGVNPMIVALAVGASMRSYANQKEAEAQSWGNGLIPCQDAMGETITRSLAKDFGIVSPIYMGWDRRKVKALQEDQTERVNRGVAAFTGGIAHLNESRAMADLAPIPGGDKIWAHAPTSASDTAEGAGQDTSAGGADGSGVDSGGLGSDSVASAAA